MSSSTSLSASLDAYNGVRSTIIDEWQTPVAVAMTRNGTFIFGTAIQGPKNTPVAVTTETVSELFGEVPTDASFDTSAVRGFYEFAQASANAPDAYIVRVGKTAAASISLYENTAHSSGDLSFTVNEGVPSESMWIRAVNEGSIYNSTMVNVTVDKDTQEPNYLKITLPDGTSQHFNLSPRSSATGVISKVSDLVNQINSNTNLSDYIYAGYTALEKTVSLSITEASPGVLNTSYYLDPGAGGANEATPTMDNVNESWGDKIVSIKSAYQTREVTQDVESGSVTATLDVIPQKNLTAGSPGTLGQFIRISEDETVLTVTPMLAGKKDVTKTLYCTKVNGWKSVSADGYSIKGNAAHGWSFVLKVKRNGSSSMSEVPASAYDLTEDGTIKFKDALSIGDVYYASYRYEVSYVEAKYRSELVTGSDRSYFIFGNTVVFGAEQPMDLKIYYTTNVYFNTGDISIVNAATAEIEFVNASNLPKAGEKVSIVLNYEPELPAATGAVLIGDVIQPGSLSGGNDGRLVSKTEYLAALKEAMFAVDLYPRRHNLVMGMYLDDAVSGYNSETGLPETVPMNMISDILPYIERSCNYTNECDLTLPVRPPANLRQDTITSWLDRLITNDSSDITRAANIIDSIQTFRVDVPVGCFIVSIPEVNNGVAYMANPATLFLASKCALGLSDSITNSAIPGSIQSLGVKIFNANIIAQLNAKRYTTAVVDYNGKGIWADGPTCAISGISQFDRQFVRDTVYTAIGLAREVAAKYIGKPRRSEYLMSLKKDVGKALGNLVPDVIDDMYVDIVPVSGGNISGKTKLRIMLTTAKEIRSIEIETHLKLAE